MNDRYKFHEFYTGKESKLEYSIIQSPEYEKINSESIYITDWFKTLKEWDEIFINLDKVKNLKVAGLNQERLNSICKIPNLTELIIEASNFENISPLKSLKKLTRLEINCNTKLTDIQSISDIKLKQLKFEQCFNIANYEVIGEIYTLKGLSLNGNWTAPKNLKINSLVPFEKLNNLEHLDLDYSIVVDKSFESILKMTKLKRFDYLANIKKMIRQNIKNKHPTLTAGFFMDYDDEKNVFYKDKVW
jgi:hypothetical protein